MKRKRIANPMAILALITLTLIWAYSWIVMKSVLLYIEPFDFTALRTVLAVVLLFFILKLSKLPMKPPPFWPTFAIGSLQTTAMATFSQLALVAGGAGKIAILVYTMPFWLVLLSVLFLKEQLTLKYILSLMLAGIGLAFILQFWAFDRSQLTSLLAVGSGLCWAISAIIAKRLYCKMTINPLSLTTWQMLYGTPLLIVIALIAGNHRLDPVPYFWFALGYNIFLATAIAWLLWLYILKNMPAGIAGISTLAIPVIGAFLSWWLLGENPNRYEITGMIIIVTALICLNFPTTKKEKL